LRSADSDISASNVVINVALHLPSRYDSTDEAHTDLSAVLVLLALLTLLTIT